MRLAGDAVNGPAPAAVGLTAGALIVAAVCGLPAGPVPARAGGGAASRMVAAAQPEAAESTETLVTRGFERLEARAFDEARVLLEDALARARREGARALEGRALWGLGDLADAQDDRPAAADWWRRAETTLRDAAAWGALADMQAAHALGAFGRRDFDRAGVWWREALAHYERAGDAGRQATVLRNLTFLPGGSRAESLSLLARALPLAEQAGDRATAGSIRHAVSDLRFAGGNLAAAWDELHAALALLEPGGPSTRLARARTSAGRLYRVLGRWEEAAAIQRENAAMLEQLGDLAGAAQALDAASRALMTGNRFDDAYALARGAQAMARRSGDTTQRVTSALRVAQALARLQRGAEALPELDAVAAGASTPSLRVAWHETRADVLWALGRAADAVAAMDEAPLSDTGALESRVFWHSRRASYLLAAGRHAEAAVASAHALALLDELSSTLVPDDVTKRQYFDRTRELVDLHVRLLVQVGRDQDAFEAAERGRARAFLDLLASRRSSATAAVAAGDPAGAGDEPSTPSPGVGRASGLADARAVAAAASAHLLSYWVAEDEVLIWVLSPDGRLRLSRSPLAQARLSALVRTATGPGADARRALRTLYRHLIAPVEASLPAAPGSLVTVVPHGPLFRLSFAGLLDERGRYLIERHAVHYAPSVGALRESPDTRTATPRAVLVADPDRPPVPSWERMAAWPRLPGARAEVRTLTSMFGPAAAEAVVGREATEPRLRQLLADASVVHFATHGAVSDQTPWASYLALTPEGPEAGSDGRLTAAELYDLRLRAELVVLAACRTASGPETGDGLTGLTRGFFAAGVPSVVASLWDLPDATAARMQPAFYRRWIGSRAPAAALRQAQLALIGDLRAGRVVADTVAGPIAIAEHPSVWAGLVVIGRP